MDLNTASALLLARVSGLSGTVAKAVVRWREQHGAFQSRQQLLDVSGLGAKTFEQSAGFLRIRGGANPLDMTGVHPETYPVVEQIIVRTGKPVDQLMGRAELLKPLKPEQFATEQFGAVTVKDILAELEKPGRDPRPDFAVARFNDGVEDIADLREGMVLEGTVSNVAAFGAFVDLGVHQDGLVHVSQLANKFVQDAREVVKTGQIVKVKVLEVDVPRKRISLTMKLDRRAAPGRTREPLNTPAAACVAATMRRGRARRAAEYRHGLGLREACAPGAQRSRSAAPCLGRRRTTASRRRSVRMPCCWAAPRCAGRLSCGPRHSNRGLAERAACLRTCAASWIGRCSRRPDPLNINRAAGRQARLSPATRRRRPWAAGQAGTAPRSRVQLQAAAVQRYHRRIVPNHLGAAMAEDPSSGPRPAAGTAVAPLQLASRLAPVLADREGKKPLLDVRSRRRARPAEPAGRLGRTL